MAASRLRHPSARWRTIFSRRGYEQHDATEFIAGDGGFKKADAPFERLGGHSLLSGIGIDQTNLCRPKEGQEQGGGDHSFSLSANQALIW